MSFICDDILTLYEFMSTPPSRAVHECVRSSTPMNGETACTAGTKARREELIKVRAQGIYVPIDQRPDAAG